ncbi:MAG TPA: TadE family protein [Bryobacteraceae bacterium]|nr:TadE family protein [Bryobacteraceae bacterium]
MRALLSSFTSRACSRQSDSVQSRHGSGSKRHSRRVRGSALVELTLLSPWVLFLFVGMVDLGFYTYSLISVENAARVGAEYTSQSTAVAADQSGACALVRSELAMLPRLGSLTTCDASPLVVSATSVAGPDGGSATSVSVTYTGYSLVPIPGLLVGTLSITRTVEMKVKT